MGDKKRAQFFISYKTEDYNDETSQALSSKIFTFCDNLKIEFNKVIGEAVDLKEFVDKKHLREGRNLHDEIKHALSKTMFLFIFLNQGWIKSDYCKSEFLFFKKNVCHGNIKDRVFVVRNGHLDDINDPLYANFTDEERGVLEELSAVQRNSRSDSSKLSVYDLDVYDYKKTALDLKNAYIDYENNHLEDGGLLAERKSTNHPTQEELYQIIVENEGNYLRKSIDYWCDGQIGKIGEEASYLSAELDGPSPYDFYMSSLLTPNVSESDKDKAVSFFKFLEDKQTKPVLLLGDAGSGKSTILAATAAVYASRVDRLSRNVDPNVVTIANDNAIAHNESFPVLLKAADIASELSRMDDEDDDDDAILVSILKAILPKKSLKTLSVPHLIDALKKRVNEYRYFILIDGLEELFDAHSAKKILWQVNNFYQDYGEHENLAPKIVVSSRREVGLNDFSQFSVLVLEPLTNEQIDDFFQSYANRSPEESERLLAKFRDRKKNARHGYRNLFRTPFLLNAYCWYLSTHEQFDGDRSVLVKEILDYDLRVLTREGSKEYSEELLLAALESLAYSAMRANEDDSKLQETYSNTYLKCISDVKRAASLIDPDMNLEDDAAKKILAHLCNGTQTLSRRLYRKEQSEHYFTTGLVCEYLAGQWIVKCNLVSEIITNEIQNVEDLKIWARSLTVVYQSFESSADNSEDTNKLVQLIFEKVLAEDDANNIAPWLSSIATILKEAARTSLSESPSVKERPGFHQILDKMSQLFCTHRDQWKPNIRNDVLSALFSTCIRFDHKSTKSAVSNLYADLGYDGALCSSNPENWVQFDSPDLSHMRMSPMPVLACEFLDFVNQHEKKGVTAFEDECWSHVPENLRGLHQEFKDIEGHSVSVWARKAVDVWNELEETPSQPMIFINWYEATAYARWLSNILKAGNKISEQEEVRLVYYSEWTEIIKFITKGSSFPWGVTAPDINCDNWYDTQIKKPAIPLTFEHKDGIFDLASNIQSWSASHDKTQVLKNWPLKDYMPNDKYIPALGNSYKTELAHLPHGLNGALGTLERRYDVGMRLVIADNSGGKT